MKLEILQESKVNEFINYCKKYRKEVADGSLSDQDLDVFKLNEENLTYILTDEEAHIIGAISIIIDEYNKNQRKGKFRIFHCIVPEEKLYLILLNGLLQKLKDLDSLILFAKAADEKTAVILRKLGFIIEGYSFYMMRENLDINRACFPEGYTLRAFEIGNDEEDWCIIRNIGFGDEGLMTPDMIHIFYEDEAYIPGGMKLLYHGDEPVGTIRINKEYENDKSYAYIASVCVKQEYRGLGLARNMLRAAIQFGKDNSLPEALLEVAVDNINALTLYTKEGFKKTCGYACYTLDLKSAVIKN